jgi:DNA adenine methylase
MGAFLRWAGSKRKILPSLSRLVRESGATHYIEPFCGSACLFFDTEIEDACLNDANRWLIETYEQVKYNPQIVHDRLTSIVNSRKIYEKIRTIHPTKFSSINGAAYFIYLNRYCFNGLFRTNKAGYFNVPYAPQKTGRIPSLKVLGNASAKLSNVNLSVGDFEAATLSNITKRSVVYLDPPYATKNARVFRQYDPASFGTEDIERLKSLLHQIDTTGAKFILSYARVPEVENIVKEWNSRELEVSRNISGFSTGRRLAGEYIVTNF